MAKTARGGHFSLVLAAKVSANIARLREAKGWSRPALAAKVRPATSPQQIERLEKNARRITVEWIERLADALEVDPLDLILSGGAQPALVLSEPVADEAARTFARVATGEEPADSLVTDLSIMLRELCETFVRHPEAQRDPNMIRPVADLLARQRGRPI